MLSPQELYPLTLLWLQALQVTPHVTATAALAHLVTALLVGQSLRPSALARALLSTRAVPARQRYQRVQRAWTRDWLTSEWVTPRLIRGALALVGRWSAGWPVESVTHLAMDSVRCGAWEIYTIGVVWHGRVVLIGWEVLPYPLPKGLYRERVERLLRRVAAAWPAAGGPVHLVADRGFPSHRLFQLLGQLGWGFTIRVRATDGVTIAGVWQPVRALLAQASPGSWTTYAAGFGRGAQAVPGQLGVGRGLVAIPWHQTGPASLRSRAAQQARRERQLRNKKSGQVSPRLVETAVWVVWFTSHPDWLSADRSYRQRWATEGSYRDAQSGWDGQHGWELETVVAAQHEAEVVEVVVGLWALGAQLQSWVGDQVSQPSAPAVVRAVAGQWTTTGRLSVWARGQLALTDRHGWLTAWLGDVLTAGAARIAAAPPWPARPEPVPLAQSARALRQAA